MTRRLATIWLMTLLVIGLSSPLSAAPQTAEVQSFPKELRDPAFLRKLTWVTDKRLESLVAGWRKYSDKQLSDELIIQRTAVIRILESVFAADYEIYNTKGDAGISIVGAPEEVTDDCDALFTWTKQALGQPQKVVNLNTPKSNKGVANLSADWLFGETRVQFWCLGIWTEDKFVPSFVNLQYYQRERLPALEDPFQIECSSQISSVGSDDKDVREAPPIGFIIDPNRKVLLWDNRSTMGKTVKFTDEEIVADLANGSHALKDQIRIDRVTASFMRTVGIEGGGSGTQRWGKCVAVAPGKKF